MAKVTINVELEDYDYTTNTWRKETTIIHHDADFFEAGGMRRAYKAYNCKDRYWKDKPMVLKMPIYPEAGQEQDVRNQVIMQAKCIMYANEFNKNACVQKKVRYVPCSLVRFLSGPLTGQFGTIEEYIEGAAGSYVKHNTVNPSLDGAALSNRNTPQAFSHFTFEISNKTEIVVDVQGVNDCYTDPQLYSIKPGSVYAHYGAADWGMSGIASFFTRHRCNPICQALGLKPIKPTDYNLGTQPRF